MQQQAQKPNNRSKLFADTIENKNTLIHNGNVLLNFSRITQPEINATRWAAPLFNAVNLHARIGDSIFLQ